MVHFKNCLTVIRLDIHSNKPIILNYGGTNDISVEIRTPNKEEREIGHKTFNAMCDTFGSFPPTPRSLPVFEAIAAGKLPPENGQAKTVEDMTRTSGHHVSLDHYPNPFSGFIDKTANELSKYPKKAIKILRWRHAQQGPPSPISPRGTYFSFDKKNWFKVPDRTHVQVVTPPSSILRTEQVNENELFNLTKEEADEPLAHELYREAKELKFNNPRSCLILAISSLEIGVKECIHRLIPDSEWLVKNLPTPPIIRILKDYFPLLPCKNTFLGKVHPPPKKLLDTIKKGISIRNELTHKGTGTPKTETLDEVLDAVYEILWLCDFYCGFEWAKNHISSNTLKLLENSQ
ncbi:hypothetical protein DO021_17550 [Desulfobacter hydrogenophilus]|uniref:ApeA N-terminal domain-containing protein n=1 Tax=Desulfobacter hydrogenophilus TaxID=2291 RepID=A0A328F816_9BACT|nr:hypothetical protein [Desulfobacter hydrogenophilus]NDY73443.1 hypothetical protein [Desulfobacter hydrogenophilus]QBH12391.1 hypothetical protein EYB58_05380 [Desulfobacter hydrogenophilus]RAM00771.1 hypothetical protein DO021_17550 [Desulfobacter hydrogenophilus]